MLKVKNPVYKNIPISPKIIATIRFLDSMNPMNPPIMNIKNAIKKLISSTS